MKAFKLLIFCIGLFLAGSVHAQVSVNINLGSPPQWGPAGYTDVRYYYLPDVEAYYDVQSSKFIYLNSGAWVHRTYLPSQYRNYDLYGGYKVVMSDYHGNTPYTHFKEHKGKYAKGYRGHEQKTYGERPGRENSHDNKSYQQKSYKKGNQGNGAKQGKQKDSGHGNGKKK